MRRKREKLLKKFLKTHKGDVDIDTLIGIGIAILLLAIIIGAYIILKGKGIDFITQIKNLFRSG